MKKLIIIKKEKKYVKDENLYVGINYLKTLNNDEMKTLVDSIEDKIIISCCDSYLDFINNCPILKSKKIIIHNNGEIFKLTDYEKLLDIRKKLNGNNVYVKLEYNTHSVQIDLAIKTIEKIKLIAESIKEKNLSPMENIMYTYDIVKDNVYGGLDEDKNKPRDLSEVLQRNNMVCVGFTNYFNSILSYLNIPCTKYYVYDHVRSCVYVKDEKYNIDGIYYFDSTWDCKKYDDEKNYLQRYVYFAKTYNYFINEDKISSFDYIFDCFYNKFSFDIENDVSLLENDCFGYLIKEEEFIKKILKDIKIKSGIDAFLLYKHDITNTKLLNKEIKKIIEERKKIFEDKWNNEIPGETMLELLKNVRKVQAENGMTQDLCALEATGIAVASGWKFSGNILENSIYEFPTNEYELIGNYCKKLDIPFSLPFSSISKEETKLSFDEKIDFTEIKYINNYKETISCVENIKNKNDILLMLFNLFMKVKKHNIDINNQKMVVNRIIDRIIDEKAYYINNYKKPCYDKMVNNVIDAISNEIIAAKGNIHYDYLEDDYFEEESNILVLN